MTDRIRVVLVEDHTIVREGLRPLLERRGVEVVGEAGDGLQAVKIVRELAPELVIMDVALPRLGGIEATHRIVKSMPDAKVIMLTIHDEPQFVYKALEAGAKGYLVKETPFEELMTAIKAVMMGETYLSSNFPPGLIESYVRSAKRGKKTDEFSQLTRREREILGYIAEGYTSPQIAKMLYMSKKTVENHRANIMEKLAIHDTAGLVRYAIKIRLVET
ncbi:MAG: response regulator transcription factor [Candidatus Krumholzibacteria bacterium]|nr:response regulator transcription factor [Candidatus Krumholzibacteria bacterium]